MGAHADISPLKRLRFFLPYLCSFLIIGAFTLGQIVTMDHSHDHDHDHDQEAPAHSCEVCIIAVSDDVDFDLELDGVDTDFLKIQNYELEPSDSQLVASEIYKVVTTHPPPSLHLRPDTARAPPTIS